MFLITETTEDVRFLTEEKDGEKQYFIEGIFMQAEKKNRNGRVYPKKTLLDEVRRYNKEYVQKNRAMGELGHPEGPTVNLERVSHIINDLREENDNIIGKAKILETPYGKIVKNLMDEGSHGQGHTLLPGKRHSDSQVLVHQISHKARLKVTLEGLRRASILDEDVLTCTDVDDIR